MDTRSLRTCTLQADHSSTRLVLRRHLDFWYASNLLFFDTLRGVANACPNALQ